MKHFVPISILKMTPFLLTKFVIFVEQFVGQITNSVVNLFICHRFVGQMKTAKIPFVEQITGQITNPIEFVHFDQICRTKHKLILVGNSGIHQNPCNLLFVEQIFTGQITNNKFSMPPGWSKEQIMYPALPRLPRICYLYLYFHDLQMQKYKHK